jgi:5'-nucleotidase
MRRAVVMAAMLVLLGACGDDGTTEDEDAAGTSTTTTVPAGPLRILVSNDDGVDGEGIDVLVEALGQLEDVEVTVYAPAENQSGTSDRATPGDDPEQETELISGYPAVAVDGFPADSVLQGLAALEEPPHLVVSGSNEGQNVGPLTEISGTVGAARTAARQGVPALAVSQGLIPDTEPDYETGVQYAVDWVSENRSDLLAGEPGAGSAEVTNLNIPTCPTGEVRGKVEAPTATEAEAADTDLFAVDCESQLEEPAHDVEAFVNGFAVFSPLTA